MSSNPSTRFHSLLKSVGFTTVAKSSRDVKLLFLQRFVRLYAYGATYIILVQFLSKLGIGDASIGLFLTLTMLGDVVISFILTLITDQVGRRKILAAGAALMAMSGLVFATSSTYWVLVLASVVGVISPSGNEIGPFKAVEESILAQLTSPDDRSDIFVWHAMCGTAGAALGTVTSGWLIQSLQNSTNWADVQVYRVSFAIYAAVGVVKLVLVLILSREVELEQRTSAQYEAVELEEEDLLSESGSSRTSLDSLEETTTTRKHTGQRQQQQQRPLQPATKPTFLKTLGPLLPSISRSSLAILVRLIALFTLDSFASGLASPSWLTYFFTTAHHVSPAALGTLFFTTSVLATLSNLLALPLSRRLGPLKTMSFTHLPSAIFLAMIPLPPFPPEGAPPGFSLGTLAAMALLALRACTQSMDQGPRQAFLAAVVKNEERTAVLGVVNVVKTVAQAGGLGVSGVFAARRLWVVTIGGAGVLKAVYDLLILWAFLGRKMDG